MNSHDAARHESEIRQLTLDFALAANLKDYALFTSTWARDGLWVITPPINVTIEGCHALNDGIERMLGMWEWFVQIPHHGKITLDGDTATGVWMMSERAKPAEGPGGHFNHGIYQDAYVLEDGRWKFAQRTYHYLYLDDSEPSGRGIHPSITF